MYQVGFTSTFKKQYKRYQSQTKIHKEFLLVMDFLIHEKPLPPKYKNHKLSGDLKAYQELHVLPDTLVIYEKDDEQKKITFAQIGSHSNLFK